MNVTCLSTQESMFETRILKRMGEPIFLHRSSLEKAQESPLILYGKWYEEGFVPGLGWLASIAYKLPYPCLLFPPFERGQVDDSLGLQVGLSIELVNTNSLHVLDEGIFVFLGKRDLRVQTDYRFVGSAGKALVAAHDNAPVVLALQPSSNATPIILCGPRIFSTSGLSDEEDRIALFEALINWATAWRTRKVPAQVPVTEATFVDRETLGTLSVLLAGTGATSAGELVLLADSIFGAKLTEKQIESCLEYLSASGLVSLNGPSIAVERDALNDFVRSLGLWSYARILRHEFADRSV